MFQYLIVETLARQLFIVRRKSGIIRSDAVLFQPLSGHRKPETKNAAVPQRPRLHKAGRLLLVRFFAEAGHTDQFPVLPLRYYITVFCGRVGRHTAQKSDRLLPAFKILTQTDNPLKKGSVRIRIHRKKRHNVIRRRPFFRQQVSAGKHHGRKRIAAHRLHGHLRLLAELALDQLHLRAARTDNRIPGQACLLQLTVNALEHGTFFAAARTAILIIHQLDILLGAQIIGERPEALSGTAGQ